LLGLRRRLLALEVFLGEFAPWLDQGKELRLLVLLLASQINFKLAALLLLDLLH